MVNICDILNWFIMVPYLTLNMGFGHQTNRDIPSGKHTKNYGNIHYFVAG